MEKKRSKGITIFSWLIIIWSILSLASNKAAKEANPLIPYYFYFIIFSASIVIGVYLLKLKQWARIAIIIISILVMAESLATAPYDFREGQKVFSEAFEKSFEEGFEKSVKAAKEKFRIKSVKIGISEIEADKKKALKSAMPFATTTIIILLLLSLGFNCGVVYYFTRPKVKEQFK